MSAPPATATAALSGKGSGDENFPVASALIHPRHRGPVLAFYRFARAADDVADHPDLAPDAKLALLDRMEAALLGEGPPDPEAEPLRRALAERGLSPRHARDLLAAFRLDCTKTRYASWGELMDYCALSAAPVGRFVLDVHGEDRDAWAQNDALCAALQVLNHLQDCGKDYRALDRVYLPLDALARHEADVADLGEDRASFGLRAALEELTERTQGLLAGAEGFAGRVRDGRLAVEVAVIHRLAATLLDRLMTRDPLRERVHLSKPGMAFVALRAAAPAALRRLRRPAAAAPAGRRA